MKLSFDSILIDQHQAYLKLLSLTPQITSDYSFINLYGWQESYRLKWAWHQNVAWIIQHYPETKLWAPVGDVRSMNWKEWISNHLISPIEFIRVPENMVELWTSTIGEYVTVLEARNDWDYIYSVSDLVALGGNRYHKKKNLVNQFKKNYDYSYLPLEGETLNLALAMQSDWCVWKDCESNKGLSSENKVIEKILSSWNSFTGLFGGAIMVDGKMVCYTIAEKLSENTLLVHFEKGNPEYKGSYQAINQIFLSHLDEPFQWVNREQDLGDEGLRKSKMSYNPTHFEKKYRVVITPSPIIT